MAVSKYFEGPRTKKLQQMSYKISALVWERSAQKSGNLLVLLAIAEHADDQGALGRVCRSWPANAAEQAPRAPLSACDGKQWC